MTNQYKLGATFLTADAGRVALAQYTLQFQFDFRCSMYATLLVPLEGAVNDVSIPLTVSTQHRNTMHAALHSYTVPHDQAVCRAADWMLKENPECVLLRTSS